MAHKALYHFASACLFDFISSNCNTSLYQLEQLATTKYVRILWPTEYSGITVISCAGMACPSLAYLANAYLWPNANVIFSSLAFQDSICTSRQIQSFYYPHFYCSLCISKLDVVIILLQYYLPLYLIFPIGLKTSWSQGVRRHFLVSVSPALSTFSVTRTWYILSMNSIIIATIY